MKKTRVLIILTIILGCFSWGAFAQDNSSTTASTNSQFTPTQVKEIEKIVENYLISNPEVLVKASQALEKKQEADAQKTALTAIQQNINEVFNDPKSPTAGNANGSVEIVEFFDYQCGHCKAMAPIVENAVKNNSNIKVIFKELPIFGGSSRYAAKAALASVAQGKYYAFHNALFAYASPLDPQSILKIAEKVGLNVNKIKVGMNAKWVNQQIRDNFQLAQKLKLLGTPAFIVSNKDHTEIRFIPGATSAQNLKAAIEDVSTQQ